MRNVYQVTLEESERQLLNDALHMASTFAAAITENVPVDFADAEIIKRVLDNPTGFTHLLIKLNKDRF